MERKEVGRDVIANISWHLDRGRGRAVDGLAVGWFGCGRGGGDGSVDDSFGDAGAVVGHAIGKWCAGGEGGAGSDDHIADHRSGRYAVVGGFGGVGELHGDRSDDRYVRHGLARRGVAPQRLHA